MQFLIFRNWLIKSDRSTSLFEDCFGLIVCHTQLLLISRALSWSICQCREWRPSIVTLTRWNSTNNIDLIQIGSFLEHFRALIERQLHFFETYGNIFGAIGRVGSYLEPMVAIYVVVVFIFHWILLKGPLVTFKIFNENSTNAFVQPKGH